MDLSKGLSLPGPSQALPISAHAKQRPTPCLGPAQRGVSVRFPPTPKQMRGLEIKLATHTNDLGNKLWLALMGVSGRASSLKAGVGC